MALTNKLSAIGNAIRSKTGGTELLTLDQMPEAIASIETGSSIDMGLEIVSLLSNGRIENAIWHGKTVPPYALRYAWYNSTPPTITFADEVEDIGDYAFANTFATIDYSTLTKVKTIGEYSLGIVANANTTQGKTLSLPEYTGKTASGGYSGSTFRTTANTFYQSYYLPKMQYIGNYVWYQNSVQNITVQIGSIGYPLLEVRDRPFGSSTGSGTITVYTTGDLVDKIKTAIENTAGANYTFIYKASADTSYNGSSFTAGEIMIGG